MRKKIVVLDMWASVAVASGPSTHWLYAQLAKEFDVEIIGLSQNRFSDIPLLCRSFRPDKKAWADKYYRLKESAVKTPGSFRTLTNRYAKKIASLSYRPDLIFQLGGLFGPVGLPGVPYLSYHDQTVRMVEQGWSNWLPENFSLYRDEFYALEKKLFKHLDKIIAYSESAKKSFNTDYGIENKNIDVINSAVKMTYPGPEDVFKARKRQLLFVSTNFFLKGGDYVVDSFSIIKNKFPDMKLIIAGTKLPAEVNFDDSAIKYVGHLSLEELQRYYCESAILLHPARYDAFPNVVKEAVVCGLPAIASASCGIPEILDYGRAGLLLKELSAAELANQVIKLLEDPQLYQQLQERCLMVRDRFDVANVGRKMIETFQAFLQ